MADTPPSTRRTALHWIGGLLSSVLGLGLLIPGVSYLLSPVRRRRAAVPAAPTFPVAQIDEVPDVSQGAAPLRATVIASGQRDAWNRLDTVKLGSVWLARRGGGEVTCLSTVCPHAGCSIDYDATQKSFVCPCHASRFDLDGTRRDGPSPRDMDRLEVELKDGEVRCRYQRFRLALGRKETV